MPVARAELLTQLGLGEVAGLAEDLGSGPVIVLQQAVEEIHASFSRAIAPRA